MGKINFKGFFEKACKVAKKTALPIAFFGITYLKEKDDKEKARAERKKENKADFDEFMSNYQTKTEGDN